MTEEIRRMTSENTKQPVDSVETVSSRDSDLWTDAHSNYRITSVKIMHDEYCKGRQLNKNNNKYECTIDRKLADAGAYSPDRQYVCTHQMAALFCVK